MLFHTSSYKNTLYSYKFVQYISWNILVNRGFKVFEGTEMCRVCEFQDPVE